MGKSDDIKKKLEVNPKTKIPQILFTIYQHVFNSIYMLSSNLNTPYPPPDLMHPMAEKIQILSNNASNQTASTGKNAAPPATPPTATPTAAPAQAAATPAQPAAVQTSTQAAPEQQAAPK